MQDLSKWSYADDFTPFEAACLTVGLEPVNNPEDSRVLLLMRRMEKAYAITLGQVIWEVWGVPDNEDLPAWCLDYAPDAGFAPLRSLKLEALLYALEKGSDKIKDWLNDEDESSFHNQRFSSHTFDSWIASIGLKSAFDFQGGSTDRDVQSTQAAVATPTTDLSAEIAFGRHQTRLLRKLVAASRKFWALYDPEDPSTAVTNEQVIAWLVAEGVTKRIAEVMATILRPEGIPSGRR